MIFRSITVSPGQDGAPQRADSAPSGLSPLGVVARLAAVFGNVSLRWILVHMLEETARHAGHLDLMREAIDGRTGD